MRDKSCILCKHFRFETGEGDLSEITPGTDAEVLCLRRKWEINLYDDSTESFRQKLSSAADCAEYRYHAPRTARLTKRQEQILSFIRRFSESRGYAPSIREIQEGLDLSSTSVAHREITILEEEGFIVRDSRIARSIRLDLE